MTQPTEDEVGEWAREAHLIIGEGSPDGGLMAFARAAYLAGYQRRLREQPLPEVESEPEA